MATRGRVQLSVAPSAVLKRLPLRLRACVDIRLLGREPVDLIVFEAGDGHVVDSRDLRRALDARVGFACLVVVGYDFTEEARAWVDAQGGLLFAERASFGWTDERWHAVRQQ